MGQEGEPTQGDQYVTYGERAHHLSHVYFPLLEQSEGHGIWAATGPPRASGLQSIVWRRQGGYRHSDIQDMLDLRRTVWPCGWSSAHAISLTLAADHTQKACHADLGGGWRHRALSAAGSGAGLSLPSLTSSSSIIVLFRYQRDRIFLRTIPPQASSGSPSGKAENLWVNNCVELSSQVCPFAAEGIDPATNGRLVRLAFNLQKNRSGFSDGSPASRPPGMDVLAVGNGSPEISAVDGMGTL
jgi:hypothetical protein